MATHDNYEHTHTRCLSVILLLPLSFGFSFPSLFAFTSSFYPFSFNPFISPLCLPSTHCNFCTQPTSQWKRGMRSCGEREREAALILMMHMKMKGEEEEERGDWPKEGYEACAAHLARLSTCTRSCIRGMRSLSLKHLQTGTYLPRYSFY